MYALAFIQESRGSGRPVRPGEVDRSAQHQDNPRAEQGEFDEDTGLSAVRELAMSLGLADSGDPISWEPA
jgi:hypothetical protein